MSLNIFRQSTNAALLTALFSAASLYIYAQPKALVTKPKPGLVRAAYSVPFGNSETGYDAGAMAFDDQYAYLATPGGLFRAAAPLTPSSQFQLIAFAGKQVINLYVHQNVLYVLKYGEAATNGPATDHTFLKSVDHGATFVPIDNGLEECIGKFCNYLTPTQALFKDDLIYLNAGGGPNLMYSSNGGASWTPLLGSLQAMTCNFQPFELVGTRMLVGGMCLDEAYLKGGILRSDLMGWTQLPTDAGTPPLGLRSVQTIENKPGTTDVYAGVGGGLLKSTDSGQTYRSVLQYSGTDTFPYVEKILFPANLSNVIVAGGRDNTRTGPFLAYSKDNGETWYDISPQARLFAGPPGESTWVDEIDFIAQDPQGRIFVGLRHVDTNTMLILQLRMDVAMLR